MVEVSCEGQPMDQHSDEEVVRKKIHERWVEILKRGDCSLNMFCQDPELLLEMARVITDGKVDGQLSEVIPKNVLMEIYADSGRCFTSEQFASFMQERLNRFGVQKVVPVSFNSEFLTLVNKSKNDEKSVPYGKLLVELQSKMCCDPSETLFFLISRGLEITALLPIVGHLLSKPFRSVCLFKNSVHYFSHLTTIVKFKTTTDIMVVQAVADLIKELNKSKYRKHGPPVLDLELVVMTWTSPVMINNVINKQFELLHQLLVSNVTGKDQWTKLYIPDFVMWFFGALVHNHANPDKKEFLIETFGLVMKNHVQRKITREEFEEIKKISVELLDWDDVNNVYLMEHLEDDFKTSYLWNTPEMLMMVAISGNCGQGEQFLLNNDIIESIALVSPSLSRTEVKRIFDYMLRFADLDAVISVLSLAISESRHLGNDIDGVLRTFVQLVRENWSSLLENKDEDNPNGVAIIETLEELADEIQDLAEGTRQVLHDLISWIEVDTEV